MDLLTGVVSCLAAFLGLVGAYIGYKTAKLSAFTRKDKKQTRYELACQLIGGDRWEKCHDYLLESGYLALSGQQFGAEVIRFFLKRKNPFQQLADYARGMRFLTTVDCKERKICSMDFKPRLKGWFGYRFRVGLNSVLYFLAALATVAPLFPFPFNLASQVASQSAKGITLYIILSGCFAGLAIMFLFELRDLCSAKRVVDALKAESNDQKQSSEE